MLDEEFNSVENRIHKEHEIRKDASTTKKKATERQINYLKQKLKNMGVDTDNSTAINGIIKEMGFESKDISELTIGEMSKIIDGLNTIVPKIKEMLVKPEFAEKLKQETDTEVPENFKQ